MNVERILALLRAQGWRVGAHNDWLRDTDGMWRTYWMLTHPQTGRYVEAEGGDDAECLQACAEQMNA
jgi:hypothetical protein